MIPTPEIGWEMDGYRFSGSATRVFRRQLGALGQTVGVGLNSWYGLFYTGWT